MRIDSHAHKKRRSFGFTFWLLTLALISLGVYSYQTLKGTDNIYDGSFSIANEDNKNVASDKIGDTTIQIPSWQLFTSSGVWRLVSWQHNAKDQTAPPLVTSPVAHGDSDTMMQVGTRIEQPLIALFAGAKADGYNLELSSAYRSVQDQTDLYTEYTQTKGKAYTESHVSLPGASEHQTGLAIDLASASPDCDADSDVCSLSYSATRWLQDHAADYGFIQRYKTGTQGITGVADEPWHYRYVGVPLAKALASSDLTFDQFVQQAAPGYAGNFKE